METAFSPEAVNEMQVFFAQQKWLQHQEELQAQARQRRAEKINKANEIIAANGSLEDIKEAVGKKLFTEITRRSGKMLRQGERAQKKEEKREIVRTHKEEHARSSAIRIAGKNEDPEFCYWKIKGFAESRGESFALTLEDFKQLWQDDCFYCGKRNARGVDRKDLGLGYVPGNLDPCCSQCKKSKGANQRSAFLSLCRKIAERHPWNDSDEIRHFIF